MSSVTAPIDHTSVHEQTLERIRNDILEGRLPGGEPLRIDALASRLGVSHMPVREALHILTVEGLAERLPRRGVVVSALTPESVRQAYETLASLEGQAAREITAAVSNRDITDLRQLQREWDDVAAGGQAEVLLPLNRRFHDRCESIVPNRWRDDFCRQLRNYVYRLRRSYPQSPARLAAMAIEHGELIDAYERRDTDLAGRLADRHCRASLAELLAQLANGASA